MVSAIAILTIFACVLASQTQQGANSDTNHSDENGRQSLAPPANASTSTNAQGTQNQSPRWYASPEWWIVILAIISLPLIWYQARETARSAKASQGNVQVMIDSERAWVLVEKAEIRSAKRPQVFDVFPVIKNHGKTVARIVKIYSSTRILQTNQDLPLEPIYEHEQKFSFVLYPNGEFQPIGFSIGRENFDAVKWGMLKLWLYGKVIYVDFQGRERYSGFCLFYYPERSGENPVREGFHPAIAVDILLKYTECT